MLDSPLQLEGYYIEVISVSLSPQMQEVSGIELSGVFHPQVPGADRNVSLAIDTKVEFGRKEDEPLRFKVRLSIESDDERSPGFPYTFSIVLVGYFNVVASYPAEQVDLLISINSPSVLYSAAREALATVTGRGLFPAVILPTVSFQPAKLQLPAQKKPSKKRKTSSKKTRRSTKKAK